jgi:hypothetical protein
LLEVCDSGLEVGPRGARTKPRKRLVGAYSDEHASIREATHHDERIVRAPAEGLCACQQRQQRRVVFGPALHGTPGQVVCVFVAGIEEGLLGRLTAGLPGGTGRRGLCHRGGERHRDEGREDRGHRHG